MSAAPPDERAKINWINAFFLVSVHLVAAFAVVYMVAFHFSWWTLGLGMLWLVLCGLAITGGYHRLFAHPTYRATWPVRLFYLLFGAAAAQWSALKWSADHREHHAQTDEEQDPYNIQRGFWWAHIGWILFTRGDEDPTYRRVDDLKRDPLIRFQQRFYVPLALLMGAGVPAAIGLAWGDPWGAVLCAGFLRLVVQWHATFSVNSVAHTIGRQPYSVANSARDSWVTALITLGEGYHNFHHRFQGDYRNGVRWWHFDPTKWFIWTLSKLGLASDLRRVPREAILRAKSEASARSEASGPGRR